MRTLVSTTLVGLALVATPALAQQHPWVPSGTPVQTTQSGDPAAVQQHPWVSGSYATTSLPGSEPAARAESRVRGGQQRRRQSGN